MRFRSPATTLILVLACCLGCGHEGSWSAHELGTDADFRDVYFLDPARGWLVGGGHPVEGGILGSTADGGQSWSFESGLVVGRARSRSVHLLAVQFLDEMRGFIVADAGLILRTVDGGRHWHVAHRAGRHLLDLQFVDDEYGWAAGGSTLIRTTDGGETWRSPIPSGSKRVFSARAIQFLDRDLGWSVGTGGAILHTADGGESWEQQIEPVSGAPDLRALSFVDAHVGWVAGEGGTILHTRNGGRTWARQEVGRQWFLTGLRFLGPKTGWAAGFDRGSSRSVVLRTLDGGETWERQLLVEGEALFALAFLESGHGWAVGERVRPHPQRLLRYEPPVED